MFEKETKKKGFTIVELLLSFTLTTIVLVYLFNVVLIIKNLYTQDGVKTQLYIKQANLAREIGKSLNTQIVTEISNCGDYCIRFTYDNFKTTDIVWDSTKGTISFGNYKAQYEKGSKIGNPTVKIEETTDLPLGTHNSILQLHIPISHKLVDEDFGVVIVYPFDNRVITISNTVLSSDWLL